MELPRINSKIFFPLRKSVFLFVNVSNVDVHQCVLGLSKEAARDVHKKFADFMHNSL